MTFTWIAEYQPATPTLQADCSPLNHLEISYVCILSLYSLHICIYIFILHSLLVHFLFLISSLHVFIAISHHFSNILSCFNGQLYPLCFTSSLRELTSFIWKILETLTFILHLYEILLKSYGIWIASLTQQT